MNLNKFKFEGKIYGIINKKIKNKKMSTLLEKIILYILIFVYKLLSIFLIKRLKISIEEAKKYINKIYSKKSQLQNNLKIDSNINNIYDLSILIPVYNSENYIEECINSIINQKTHYKYEIIIVNDGSTDNTEKILFKYRHIRNINIIKQENKGIAIARNVCLENSKGKYIMYIDSDDILLDNAIEIFMNIIEKEKVELVQCSYYKFNQKEKTDIIFKQRKLDNINDKYDILKIPGYPWGKVIKKELFNQNNFISGYAFEDTIIPYKILSQCKSAIILEDVLYGYRINEKGITKKITNNNKCLDTVFIIEDILRDMKSKKYNISYELYLFTLNCQFSYIVYYRIKKMDINIQKNIFIIMCDIIKKMNLNTNKKESFLTKNIEKSFKNQNFQLWKYTSIILNFLK